MNEVGRSSGGTRVIAGLAFALLWFFWHGLIASPSFGHTDIYYFKDAGINLASGLGFTSRFTFGNPTFEPLTYAHYPPLYPLSFGLFECLFGISTRSNQAFNSALGTGLGFAAYLLVRRPSVLGLASRPAWIELLVAALLVVAGGFGAAIDRPDGLGVVLGGAGIVVAARGGRPRDFAFAGILHAASVLTSVFTGAFSAFLTTALVLARHGPVSGRAWRDLVLIALSGALALGAGVLALLATMPGWLERFLGVALGRDTANETGGGYFLALLRGEFRVWAGGFAFDTVAVKLEAAKWAVALVLLVVASVAAARRGWPLPVAGLVFAALLFLPGIMVPYQAYYLGAGAALALVACMSLAGANPAHRRLGTAAGLGALGVALLSLPMVVHEVIARVQAAPTLANGVAIASALRGRIQGRERFIAVAPTIYMAWREAGIAPLTTQYSGFKSQENRDRLEYLALGYPGSGQRGKPQAVDFDTSAFLPLWQPDLAKQSESRTASLVRSTYTWEPALLARSTCPECREPIRPHLKQE